MRRLIIFGILTMAGAVGAGLLVFPAAVSAAPDGKAAILKRDDQVSDLVLVPDDDDGDDEPGVTGQTRTRGTADAAAAGDQTRGTTDAATAGDQTHGTTDAATAGDQTRGTTDAAMTRDGQSRDLTADLTGDRTRGATADHTRG